MFKLELEKAEEPETRLPISTGSSKKQESSGKISISAFDYTKSFDVWITTNCGIFLKLETSDHLTCLLINLHAGQEAALRTGHETTDWFQTGKGVRQGCVLSSCLFNFSAEYVMQNSGLDEVQAGIKIARKNINSDMQMTPSLCQKVKRN